MANFLKDLFGGFKDEEEFDRDEGFVDYGASYDVSSSAVTNEEADYSASSVYESPKPDYSSYKAPSKIMSMHTGAEAPKLYVMKPSGYDEVMNGAVDMLREGTIIFLNLNGIDKEVGTRIVDFMTGVAAAFEGRIKKVDTCCYAVAPKNVEWINTIDD